MPNINVTVYQMRGKGVKHQYEGEGREVEI